jgi:hypothetical protein
MQIETLREAIGDEKFAALKGYVDDLTGQRDAARQESIDGRKKLKSDLAAAQSLAAKALEKLGVDTADDLDALPDAKGQGEATKQLESKLKRAERERDEAKALAEETNGKFRGSLQKAAIAEALSGHEFVARDIVESYISQRLTWDGDDLQFKTDDGKLVAVKDGVAGVAKSRPELLKAAGTGGAGMRQSNAGGSGGAKTVTRSQYDAMTPAEKAAMDWKTVSMVD